ncbi:MAG: DUF5011 domain-containing protein [Clostridia bacterium]|nr:DUF5011 domain-containing protein [Clostridia bacterium]
MKKIKFIALPIAAALCLGGAACTKSAPDEAPEITGVSDRICAVGEEYDLIGGIAALDKEDGDITPSLKITLDGEEVDGFYTSFDAEGDYELVYSVTDSKGHVAEETAIVSAVGREVYKSFDLVNLNGFEVKTSGGAKCSQSVIGDGDNLPLTLKTSGAKADGDVILTREYTLNSGAEYTFKYYLKSNVAGTAKAKIGSGEAVDLTVTEGDNVLTFTYNVPADEQNAKVKADVQLLLGGLGDAQIDVSKAEAQHVGLLEKDIEFKIGGNIVGRFDQTEGDISASEDGTYATLNVTKASADKYRGGMFINTGVNLIGGRTYKVSYELDATQPDFGVVLQNKQWNETRYGYATISSEADYTQENSITPTVSGGLWLYIEAGTAVNEVTISNLKITSVASETVTESYGFGHTFKMFAYKDAPNYVQWIDGKLIFEVEKFGNTDYFNKIESPQFYVDTAGIEFMISFRAKATAPVLVTWVGPKSGGWDPNLVWRQFNLTDTEQLYTFKGNESDSSNHQFEWQFGFSVNQKYENVTIEISDIVIYWPNGLIDD